MTFKDDLENDLDTVFFNADEFAEPVVYGIITIDAIINRLKDLDVAGQNAAKFAQMHVKKKDIPAPKYGDQVNFDGEPWNVERIESHDNFVFILTVRAKETYVF